MAESYVPIAIPIPARMKAQVEALLSRRGFGHIKLSIQNGKLKVVEIMETALIEE